MLNEPVRQAMARKNLLFAPPETSVLEAAKRMAARKVGAVMVAEAGRLLGIFTERDVVFRVVAMERDVRTTQLRDVMTADPLTISPDDSLGYALLLMHENGFRHLPVVEDGVAIGIVSARNALDPELEEFESESRRREDLRRKGRTAGGASGQT